MARRPCSDRGSRHRSRTCSRKRSPASRVGGVTAPGCLDPANCRVPDSGTVDLRHLRLIRLAEGETLHVSYRHDRWPALFNASGRGNARFSPLLAEGKVIPTMYLAATQTVALLETAFHDVHRLGARIISERLHLATRGLVAVT